MHKNEPKRAKLWRELNFPGQMKIPPKPLPEDWKLSNTRLAVAVQILETETDPAGGF